MEEPDHYNFAHSSRGVAIIINNTKLQGESAREGADKDTRNLKRIFQNLGFTDDNIRYWSDLTVMDMLDNLRSVAGKDHSNSDCFVCAISSHGTEYLEYSYIRKREDMIGGTDGPVFTRQLVDIFNDFNCPTLWGKPRIFFFQACRGGQIDPGTEEISDVRDESDLLVFQPSYHVYPAPCFKDFLIMYATPPGFRAFRRTTTGSWFVDALNHVVQTADLNVISLNRLLTRVINHVGRQFKTHPSSKHSNDGGNKQSPCIYSMLTKDVYFRTKPYIEGEAILV